MSNLSPAAQEVLDAYAAKLIGGIGAMRGSDRPCLAAALRAVANEIVPETPPLFEPWATAVDLELLKKDERRSESIRVHQCLMNIADELEGVKHGIYSSPLPPSEPTDKELCETYVAGYYACENRQGPDAQAAGLRAVLARWGKGKIIQP